MCGRLNITDSPGVRALCDQLEITLWPEDGQLFSRFKRATDAISIVCEEQGRRVMKNATWWLLLSQTRHTHGQVNYTPSRYTSFNTRYDKLNNPGSAGYQAYRHQRCVIPVTGFGESQKSENGTTYHDMSVVNHGAMALGGLYRAWSYTDKYGQCQQIYSCSVVTLPPHPKLRHIHQKSTPLMLSMHDGSLTRWLDASSTQTEALTDLLIPRIRQSLDVTPIDKPSSHVPTGSTFIIEKDEPC